EDHTLPSSTIKHPTSKDISKKFASQAPKDSTKFSNRNNVGPSSSAETVSTPASERLMEDIHFIPLPTPETTDAVEINVMAIINTTSKILSAWSRSEEHTSELQSRFDLVCRLLLEKKKKQK